MLLHKEKGTERKLTLGDYVTVHVQDAMGSQDNNGAAQNVLLQKEAFLQRIVRQRGEMCVKRHITDSVIIVDKRPREDQQDSSLLSGTG
jgi:hypothetical protein